MERLPLYVISTINSRNSNLVRVGNNKAVEQAAAPSACKMTFAEVLQRDYDGNTYGLSPRILSMFAISIDAWEILRSKTQDMTIDACVGIATHDMSIQYGTGFTCSDHRLLMVEFKLRCKSSTSVKLPDLKGKVQHTRPLFVGHKIDRANVFLFPSNLVSYYQRTLKQYQNGKDKNDYANWEIMSPESFNNYIAFEEDLPYQPINSKEDIISHINATLVKNDSKLLEVSLNHWRKKITDYRNTYQVQEANHIEDVVKELWGNIIAAMADEGDRRYMEMEFPDFRTENNGD